VIPLGIELDGESHTNILLYDKKLNQIERFEPHGSSYPSGFNYNPKYLDDLLESKFITMNEKTKYISPEKYQSIVGLQKLEAYGKKTKIGDPGGFCSVWTIWWVEQRMKNEDIPIDKLHQKLINFIKIKNVSFRDLIRNYSQRINNIRDSFLKRVDIDINDFLNDDYSNEQAEQLTTMILEEIEKN